MARVLLIDDEPIYYKMIVHALKPHGYEVSIPGQPWMAKKPSHYLTPT
jgi:CheY-like chemotaxis protein